jgi:hypothetical protein
MANEEYMMTHLSFKKRLSISAQPLQQGNRVLILYGR